MAACGSTCGASSSGRASSSIFVAAGLAAGALRSLHEAGLWNHLQQPVWDLTRSLPVSSVLGTVLSGLFGYHDAPVLGEVLVWALSSGSASGSSSSRCPARPLRPAGA